MSQMLEAEKIRRRESNQDVLGSHAMEGIFPDEATISLMRRFEDGELTREELSAAIDCHVQDLLAARTRLAGAA